MVLAVPWVYAYGLFCMKICGLWGKALPQALRQALPQALRQWSQHVLLYQVGTGGLCDATTAGQARLLAQWVSAAPPTERQSSHPSHHVTAT